MPRPHNLPDDTVYLDVDHASHLILAYMRGMLGRAIFRFRLIVECGYPEHIVQGIIRDVDDTSKADKIAQGKVYAKELGIDIYRDKPTDADLSRAVRKLAARKLATREDTIDGGTVTTLRGGRIY